MPTSSDHFELDAFLAVEHREVEAARRRVGDRLLRWLAPSLAEPIRYALDAGGKRLRPILCVSAYRAVAGEEMETEPAVYDVAVALEFIHTYSLVHDDLPCMDDDDLRRGRPTTHRVHGVPAAVLAGAALIPLAALVVEGAARPLGLDRAEFSQVVRTLATGAGAEGMVGGQWLDLEAEGGTIDFTALEEIHHRKTGALLATAARLGGVMARAEPARLEALTTYGQALGLAFQITDDILDLIGDPALIGKTAGRDLTMAKVTYPALTGVEVARTRALGEVERACKALRQVGLETTELRALAHFAVERNH